MIDTEEVKKGIMKLLLRATPENRRAVINLLPAAKSAIDSGFIPSTPHGILHSWRCLLTLLAGIAAMQTAPELIFQVSNALLEIADRMVPPEEAVREGAEILTHTFHADLYVCRMRDREGNWKASSADCLDGSAIPMLAPILEESILRHPVIKAVHTRNELFVVSNDLHGIEHGGESFDCVGYQQGYRSRLSFILRENPQKPFGLVMLYSRQEFNFEHFEDSFLRRCARILNLAVGRRIALARDTLEKVAGGMAHYGNNALNIMRVKEEYAQELSDFLGIRINNALERAEQIAELAPAGTQIHTLAHEIKRKLAGSELSELDEQLSGVINQIKRMSRLISSLKESAVSPRLLEYVHGVDVLQLDDNEEKD